MLASACALIAVPAASARPLHHHHRLAAHHPAVYAQQDGAAFNAGAAQVPPKGTYDNYRGPGATVLKRGLDAQHEPGVAQEIAPDAKQSATGGPAGGLPGRDSQ